MPFPPPSVSSNTDKPGSVARGVYWAMMLALAVPILASTMVGADLPAAIHIDPTQHNQVLDGFGTFGGYNDNWHMVISPKLADTLVDDLGISIARIELRPEFEPADLGANDQDLSKYNGMSEDVYQFIRIAKVLHAKGVERFLLTVWTPPPWMKTPGNHGHAEVWCQSGNAGGSLLPENYGKFANYLVQFLKFFKREVGVDAYALSPQNELAFDEAYNSCVYTPQAYAALVGVIGKRFAADGITTKLLGPEDIGYHQRVMGYINGVLTDPVAGPAMGIVAIHAYDTDGVRPDSPSAQTWNDIYNAAHSHGLPFWMTETSGFSNDLPGGMRLAKAMYVGLAFGHVDAWIDWQASDKDGISSLMCDPDGATRAVKYYATKQFFRFLRPGAVSIGIHCENPDVLPLAFSDQHHGTCTCILINPTSQDISVTIPTPSGWPSSLTLHRTSDHENCQEIGAVSGVKPLVLPAMSISTLSGKLVNRS